MTVATAVESFIRAYCEALDEGTAAVFAGAGLSIPAGLVDWRGLLRDIARDIGLDVDQEHDLISVAQFHVNEKAGRHRVNQALVAEFAERAQLSENHSLLAGMPISTYWTTNYDNLIESALRAAHKRPDVKSSPECLALTLPRRDAVVYKMHGDVSQPDKAVVTRDDYEGYDESRRLFSIALQGDLVSKTFLFLGFSFADPNLAYILARIRILLGTNRRDHYCLLRKVQRGDFPDEAAYTYARARQELQTRDLRRYGITGILTDSHQAQTDILRSLSRAYKLRRVFVSGSAADYAPWTEGEALQFLHDLGRELIAQGFGVVTGFGIGVGPYLLNGVLDGLGDQGSYSLGDRVILRPFPQGEVDEEERSRRQTDYRKAMLSHAGIALFVFGNTRGPDGVIHNALGVEEEFRLAEEAGLALLPVGCTGHISAELHSRVLQRFDKLFPGRAELRAAVEALGERAEPKVVLNRIMQALSSLKDRPSPCT